MAKVESILKNLNDHEEDYFEERMKANPYSHTKGEQSPKLIQAYIYADKTLKAAWTKAKSPAEKKAVMIDADISIMRAIILGNDSPAFGKLKKVFHTVGTGRKHMPQITSDFKLTSLASIADTNGFGTKQKISLDKGLEQLNDKLLVMKESLEDGWTKKSIGQGKNKITGEDNFRKHYVGRGDSEATVAARRKELIGHVGEMIKEIKIMKKGSFTNRFRPFISDDKSGDPRYGQTEDGLPLMFSDRFWYDTSYATVVGRLGHELSHRTGWTDDTLKYGTKATRNALDSTSQSNHKKVFENADSFRFWLMGTELGRRTSSKSTGKSVSAEYISSDNYANVVDTDVLDKPAFVEADTNTIKSESSDTTDNPLDTIIALITERYSTVESNENTNDDIQQIG